MRAHRKEPYISTMLNPKTNPEKKSADGNFEVLDFYATPFILNLRAYSKACVEQEIQKRSDKVSVKHLLGTFNSSSSDTVYSVYSNRTCTCPGYSFRRNCKHIKELF
jgi:hypothetical protein